MFIIGGNSFKMFLFLGVLSALSWSYIVSSGKNTRRNQPNYSIEVWGGNQESRIFYEVVENGSTKLDKKLRMGIDQAVVTVESKIEVHGIQLLGQTNMCVKCPLLKLSNKTITYGENMSIIMDTRWPMQLGIELIYNTTYKEAICLLDYHYGEHGEYSLVVSGHRDNFTCIPLVIKHPINSYISIYVMLGIIAFIAVVCTTFNCLNRKGLLKRCMFWKQTENIVNSDLGSPTNVTADDKTLSQEIQLQEMQKPKKVRLKSLDTFRGLSLMIMIFVNYKGGYYWFFHHIPWFGLTVADLVFPWFVFIMGTSIALAFRGQLQRGMKRRKLAVKVINRTLILFFLGLVVGNGGRGVAIDLDTLRIPGVLQRLAVSYCVVAMLEVLFAKPGNQYEHSKWAAIRDILPYWPEWLIALSLVILHLCLTFLLPVPNCPTGYLGPGGLHDNGSHFHCTGGAAGYIDRKIFGVKHIYQHPTSTPIYLSSVPFDPEGALGTLTSIFMCFLGLQAGKILITYSDWVQRVKRWILWSIVTGAIAGGLCEFTANTGLIPVCKNLWSLSFILALASMAYFLLALMYIVIDVFHIWSGTPFFYPGMNSIVVYMCSEVLHSWFPVDIKVPHNHAAMLAINIYGASIWLLLSVVLYYKNIFIAV